MDLTEARLKNYINNRISEAKECLKSSERVDDELKHFYAGQLEAYRQVISQIDIVENYNKVINKCYRFCNE